MFWGDFFEENFCPVFHGGSSLRKFSKKSKKFQNSKNNQNHSQKCPNVFWRCFRMIFSKTLFAQCSIVGRVFEKFQKKSKNFQNSNNALNRSQKCPNVFWRCFRVIFLNFFCPVFHGESSLRKFSKKSEKFQNSKNAQNRPQNVQTKFFKIKKNFKLPKKPKIIPKTVQTCFEDVLRWFFRKNFLPSVPWWVESSKIFKKIKKFSKFQKWPKSFPKVSKRVLKMF